MTQSIPTDDALATWRGTLADAQAQQMRGVDTFVRGAVLGQTVFAVVGPEGIAAVSSPRAPERLTYLFWSHQAEAERWADVLTPSPRIVAVDLAAFIAITLPEMIRHGALAGADWSADPIEAEIEPQALGAHLRDELARDFAFRAGKTRLVFLLDREGNTASVTAPDGQLVTPVWAERQLAEAACAAIGDPSLVVVRKPLLELTNRYLLSAEGVRSQIAPGYVHASGCLHMSPWAFKALLNGGGRPPARIAVVA